MGHPNTKSYNWDNEVGMLDANTPIFSVYALPCGGLLTATEISTTYLRADGTSVSHPTPPEMDPIERGEG